jgi:casein kinase II subunit beta
MEYSGEYSVEDEEEEAYYEGWIQWHTRLKGHEFLLCVDDEFIRDSFNLYGLRLPRFTDFIRPTNGQKVNLYNEALKMILSERAPDQSDFERKEFLEIYEAAIDLYSLIHARYVMSPQGMDEAREMYMLAKFGTCPRVL